MLHSGLRQEAERIHADVIWLVGLGGVVVSARLVMMAWLIGAQSRALRVNLASCYGHLAGAALTRSRMIQDGAESGWTFYAPYWTTTLSDVTPVAIGVFVFGVSRS